MKKTVRRVASLLLVPILVLSLFSCSGKPTQSGIVISPETEYEGAAKLCARSTFYELLAYYTKQTTGVKTLPNSTQARLTSVAQNMATITEQNPIDEMIFVEAMTILSTQGPGVIDELILYSATRVRNFPKTRALYLSLASILDSDAIIDTCYQLLLYGYDYRYRDAMAKYEQYGYAQHKEEAETLKREHTVLSKQIGQEGFKTVFLHSLVFSDLFFADALTSDELTAFTDAEILLFLKSLELSETQIQAGGWELILEKLLPERVVNTYASRLGAELLSTGDYKNLAAVMNDLTALFTTVSERLTEIEIALLRSGDRAGAMRAILQKFTDDDFARLSRIAAISLNKDAYHAIALQTYGAKYSAYARDIQPIGITELRESLGTPTFYESLEKYIAGISPAFSYGMRK